MLDKIRALNTLSGVMNQLGQIPLRTYAAHRAQASSLRHQGNVRVCTGSLGTSLPKQTDIAASKPSAPEGRN